MLVNKIWDEVRDREDGVTLSSLQLILKERVELAFLAGCTCLEQLLKLTSVWLDSVPYLEVPTAHHTAYSLCTCSLLREELYGWTSVMLGGLGWL